MASTATLLTVSIQPSWSKSMLIVSLVLGKQVADDLATGAEYERHADPSYVCALSSRVFTLD